MIDAIYYDGQSTRRHPVTLMMHKRVLAIRGEDVRRSARLSRLDVSERLEHAPRILRFPDGGFIEVVQQPLLDKMLRKNGYREPRVVRWQQNWLLSLCALVAVLASLIAGYQWGLPWAADNIAQHLPESFERKIGDEGLKLIDQSYMHPSRLDAREQARLRALFAGLVQPEGGNTTYRLEFRSSKIGPNAFALPNGVIVMTDELVQLANNDQAVLGVLAHELGHVRYRHSTRRLLQAFGLGIAINLVVGDVSTVLASAPTFLLDQKYSRDFEREADGFAIAMMQANRVPLSPMADLFEKMAADRTENDGQSPQSARKSGRKGSVTDYFSSHPSDGERTARLRAADARP